MKNMTGNQKHNQHEFCSEPLDKIEHYEEASAEDFVGWCMHHRLEIQPDGTRVSAKELIDKNLYYGRPASELVFMRKLEHHRLHWIGNTFNKGKHHSEEHRQKMSKSRQGMLWWNNGISSKRSRECPGEGWTRGYLRFK